MSIYAIAVLTRLCLGGLLVLNGPVNVLALGVVVLRTSKTCTSDKCSNTPVKPKACCPQCQSTNPESARAQGGESKTKTDGDDLRPTCPACPSCPNYPGGVCLGCPVKAPCFLPPVTWTPQSPTLIWLVTDSQFSLPDSHPDERFLPPRS
jgi:hypothetical protein